MSSAAAGREEGLRFDTRAVHGPGEEPVEGPVVAPIHRSATFRFRDTASLAAVGFEERKGDFYTRYDNPSFRSVERRLASLEETEGALLFGSGLAAISAVLFAHLRPGNRLVATRGLYGGTLGIFALLRDFGVEVVSTPVGDLAALEGEIRRGARLLYTETPTNPLVRIVDLRTVAAVARAARAILVVDSTFGTPYNQRPAALGADLVVHSATKYLGGHADLLGGVVAGARERLVPVERVRRTLGGIADPSVAWLLERSLKTLALRVARSNENALAVARFLRSARGVARVHYPGLPDHPDHGLARAQMRGFGGVLSFEVEGGARAAAAVADRLRLFVLAPSLGGVESLVSHPSLTSHATLSPEERAAEGIGDGLVRLAVGIEDAGDLVGDLRQALEAGFP